MLGDVPKPELMAGALLSMDITPFILKLPPLANDKTSAVIVTADVRDPAKVTVVPSLLA